jgi:rhamnose transport system permease protein
MAYWALAQELRVTAGPQNATLRRKWSIRGAFEELILIVALAVLVAVMSSYSPYFLTPSNLLESTRSVTEVGLIALGMTLVVLTGGIDLSVGSTVALTSVAAGMLMSSGVEVWIACALSLLLGALCGLTNGLMIVRLNMPPIIATIATLAIYRGAALGLSGSKPYEIPDAFYILGQAYVGPIPLQLIILAVCALILAVVLKATYFGRVLLAIGNGETAARFAGLHTDRAKIVVYVISGFLSALAAMIFISRVSGARENAGLGYELDAITVVVLGGASISGGRGSILGTLLGLLLIGLLRNGLTLAFVPAEVQTVFVGAFLIGAAILNRALARFL